VVGAQSTLQSAQLSLQKTAASAKSYDIAASYASVLAQQANLESAQNNLANATLKAPSAGVVASVSSQIGEFVTGGGTANPFILLADTAGVALHGTIGEADVAKLQLGQVATITVDAVGTARMTGKVSALDPLATIAQGVPVYGVDVLIDIPNPQIRPGMSGTAAIIIASRQNVLTVPNLAVRTTNGRRYVQLLKDGQPVDTDVTFGISNETITEVVTGLQEGDTVVLPQPRAASSGAAGGGVRIGGGPGAGR
jgi:RND family efflux transporter MFP subunit